MTNDQGSSKARNPCIVIRISSFFRDPTLVIRHWTERLIQHACCVPAARLPPPAKPTARVPQRLDFASFAAIDHPHRNELDPLSGRDEFAKQFRFNLEMVGVQVDLRPDIQAHQPKAALCVGQPSAGQTGYPPAHPTVHSAPQPRHFRGIDHAIADDQRRSGSFRTPQKRRNVRRGVLAVAIQGQCPGITAFARPAPPCRQSRAFSSRAGVPDDLGPGASGQPGRSIGRAIVNDDHRRKTRSHFADQGFDSCGLVQARNHGGASRRQIHRQTLVSGLRIGQDKFCLRTQPRTGL